MLPLILNYQLKTKLFDKYFVHLHIHIIESSKYYWFSYLFL